MKFNGERREGPEWKRLGQYKDNWKADVNTVMDPGVL